MNKWKNHNKHYPNIHIILLSIIIYVCMYTYAYVEFVASWNKVMEMNRINIQVDLVWLFTTGSVLMPAIETYD